MQETNGLGRKEKKKKEKRSTRKAIEYRNATAARDAGAGDDDRALGLEHNVCHRLEVSFCCDIARRLTEVDRQHRAREEKRYWVPGRERGRECERVCPVVQ